MSQNAHTASTYLQTQVMTASPAELRLMLIDGAVKFARQGRDGLAAGDYGAAHTGFSRCRNILMELISSMRPEIDPDLCARMSALYTFMFNQLVRAGQDRDTDAADKVIELLEYDRQTWTMLIERLARERAGGAPEGNGDPAPADASSSERRSISVEG